VRVEREAVLNVFPADFVAAHLAIGSVLGTVDLSSPRPADNASNTKPTKPKVAAQALIRLFPSGRPSLSGAELALELKTKAPEIGTISGRTLTRAISEAWSRAEPKPAK
jgi:excisionase family DNA binding protein